MNNAKKFLRDGVSVEEFVKELVKKISYFDDYKYYSEEMEHEIILFLEEQVITEDEKIILRNIDKQYKYIGRMKGKIGEQFYVKNEENFKHCFCMYNHLFKFIKERRRI